METYVNYYADSTGFYTLDENGWRLNPWLVVELFGTGAPIGWSKYG